MNLTEVKKSIEKQLSRELRQGSVRNIVFWYDEEGSFADDIDGLELTNAKIIKLYDNNAFAIKRYIEDTDKTSNLLVYSPMPRPSNKDNWLTDTIKYSQTFSTDKTSLILLNHKIDSSLRHAVDKYKTFFDNQDRCKKFDSYALAPYSETKIDVGVLSALCKLTAPNFDNVVKTLLIELTNNETTITDSIAKFADTNVLWVLIEKSYGYNFPEQSLNKLSIMLLVTHLSNSINGSMPKEWKEYVSSNTNCFVFVDNLMKNTQLWNEYNTLAELVADKLNLTAKISACSIDEIIDCDTFNYFDKNIIKRISENITLNVVNMRNIARLLTIEETEDTLNSLKTNTRYCFMLASFSGYAKNSTICRATQPQKCLRITRRIIINLIIFTDVLSPNMINWMPSTTTMNFLKKWKTHIPTGF